MDADQKKTALRSIPYGLYVLTADDGEQKVASTINWVTQTSFVPPLVVAGVKKDSSTFTVATKAGAFALNVLGKEQGKAAYAFFKPAVDADGALSGEPYVRGETGAPLLTSCPSSIECKVVEVVDRGDHAIVVGEVVAVSVRKAPEGRADAGTLRLEDLGEKVFYGG